MINDNSYCLLMKKKQRQEITNYRKMDANPLRSKHLNKADNKF